MKWLLSSVWLKKFFFLKRYKVDNSSSKIAQVKAISELLFDIEPQGLGQVFGHFSRSNEASGDVSSLCEDTCCLVHPQIHCHPRQRWLINQSGDRLGFYLM